MALFVRIALIVLVVVIAFSIFAYRKNIARGIEGLREFYREIMAEMRKVAWPSKDDVINSTAVVAISTLVLVVLLVIVDGSIGKLVSKIFSL